MVISRQVQPQKASSIELYRQILAVVALVPEGYVATYGQIAKLAGLPKHARLVGTVLKQMSETSDLPWHRIINAQGRISTGQINDAGQNIQQLKLIQEGIIIKGGRIDWKKYQWMTDTSQI